MSQVDAELVLGQKLLEWLHVSGKSVIALREVYQLGPRPIRDRDTALTVMGVLEAHGWVIKTGPIVIDGKHRRDAWRIVSPPDEV